MYSKLTTEILECVNNLVLVSLLLTFSRLFLLFRLLLLVFTCSNGNTRKRCEICSKLTIKIPERRDWCPSVVFIVNFEHIAHLFLMFQLLNLNK